MLLLRTASVCDALSLVLSAQVLWTSERDGWMHIYLYDFVAGSCRQLTKGEWVVRAIEHWDETQRLLYFSAAGREQPDTGAVDPYLRHLYCAHSTECVSFVSYKCMSTFHIDICRDVFAGAGLAVDAPNALPTLLTPEPADHAVSFSPNGQWFTDCYSRADLPTVAVLRAAADGRVCTPWNKLLAYLSTRVAVIVQRDVFFGAGAASIGSRRPGTVASHRLEDAAAVCHNGTRRGNTAVTSPGNNMKTLIVELLDLQFYL